MNSEFSVGHPVDVASGRVFKKIVDFSLPGSPKLRWTRRYSSTSSTPGPLGPGWTASYFAGLRRIGKDFFFYRPEGGVNVFSDPQGSLNGGGTLRNFGAFEELAQKGSGYVITRWEIVTSSVQKYVFEPSEYPDVFYLASISELGAGAISLAYESSGALLLVRPERSPRALVLTYDRSARVSAVSLAVKGAEPITLVSYGYGSDGRLEVATDALGGSDQYAYDHKGRMVSERLKCGQHFTFTYDERDRCIQTTGLNRYDEKTLKYFSDIGWTHVSNSQNALTRYEWNDRGQVVTIIRPLGAVCRFEYDAYGRQTKSTYPNSSSSAYEYDEAGNCTSRITPVGKSTYEFDSDHVSTSYTDLTGGAWKRKFNSAHRVVESSDPLGATWSYKYDADGQLSVGTDPLGARTTYLFSSFGELQQRVDPLNQKIAFKYDDSGRLVKLMRPDSTAVDYTYDLLGRLTSTQLSNGSREAFTYDLSNKLASFTDTNGNSTYFRYGDCGRIVSRLRPDGRQCSLRWGSEPGALLEVLNEIGQSYQYQYDLEGRVVRETNFEGLTTSFTYDGNGYCTSTTNGAGEIVEYERGIDGRPTKARLPGNEEATFEYDPYGSITKASNKTGELLFTRDPLGRVIQEQQLGVEINRTFDAVGRLLEVVTSTGYRVKYEYNLVGQVTGISSPGASVKILQRLADRERVTLFEKGIQLSEKYDVSGRLTRQALTGCSSEFDRNYSYDLTGRLRTLESQRDRVKYTYDSCNRLISAVGPGASEQFQYDNNDNVVSGTSNTALSRQYGPGDQLQASEKFSYEYDGAGRLTGTFERAASRPEQGLEWDALGQLTKVTDARGQVWEYTYDAIGRRSRKTGPFTDISYVWSGSIIAQQHEASGTTRSWIYSPGQFTPVLSVQADSSFAVVADHAGVPRELISLRDGLAHWESSASVWGNSTVHTLGSGVSCPHRLMGQWHDPETGFCYNRFRYYNPEIGRFISPDPIRLSGGLNLYNYPVSPLLGADFYGLGYLYRGMAKDSDGSPAVYSGPTGNGQNAANSLGARPGEPGMSTNTDPNAIQNHRRPEDFGPEGDPGTQKNSAMYRIDEDKLAENGLVATNDHDTHVNVNTAPGVPPEELPQRLAQTEPLWEPITREQYDKEQEENKDC